MKICVRRYNRQSLPQCGSLNQTGFNNISISDCTQALAYSRHMYTSVRSKLHVLETFPSKRSSLLCCRQSSLKMTVTCLPHRFRLYYINRIVTAYYVCNVYIKATLVYLSKHMCILFCFSHCVQKRLADTPDFNIVLP